MNGRPQLHNKDTLVSNLELMFERIEYVNIDATDQTGEAGIAAIEVRIVSLTHLAKGGSNPAHGKEEQEDDHHPELAEKKNVPADNGTQKVLDGTSLSQLECSDLDLTQLKWT
ncbi:hypothetical protein THAOC_12830 [Thalassiosira oceanica]|uniref:Uncharacterized protein n=1 Tax=Thalassiosira oceanica TaxID=159749 RepID=K0SMQ3_THAOC|nr:hypothetical protein THAOC_12830 [Thalassiosira oceanica]|eukprot:EJK66264.1 hypothetical protein THAOC_12830 [Thalassiosira oceanica]